jgi:hypothetical protein
LAFLKALSAEDGTVKDCALYLPLFKEREARPLKFAEEKIG